MTQPCSVEQAFRAIWAADSYLISVIPIDKVYPYEVTYNDASLNYVVIRNLGSAGEIRDDTGFLTTELYQLIAYVREANDLNGLTNAIREVYNRFEIATDMGHICSGRVGRLQRTRRDSGVRVLTVNITVRLAYQAPRVIAY